MNKQEFLDLCPVYALGALDGEDLIRFREAMARADDEMKAALAEARRLAENLSLAAPEAAPSPEAKARLMARIRAERAPESAAAPETVRAPEAAATTRPRRAEDPAPGWLERLFGAPSAPRPGLAMAFSLLALAGGLLAYAVTLRGAVERQDGALAQARQRIVALEDSLSQKEALLDVIRSREMQVAVMNGLDAAPAGYGKVIWDPERKTAVLHVSLPPQPDDKDYQLWIIRDQKPVDAGVFHVSDVGGRDGFYRIERLAETDRARISAFAVTLEPKGGVPQPTGAMYLAGGVEI